MKDELTPLIAAYRAENRGSSLDARAVRERVLTATWRRRRRRLRRAVWLLPIAAVLVGTGALAASAPARASVSRVLAELGLVSPAVQAPPPARQATSRRSHAATLAPTPALAALPTEVTTAAPATAAATSMTAAVAAAPPPASITAAVSAEPTAFMASPSLTPSHRASRVRAAAVNASATAPTDQVTAAPDTPASASAKLAEAPTAASRTNAGGRTAAALAADITTYRAAHELHFARADYAHALVAWDSYLARFPHGTFTPEARLNRAVCLARLGKAPEARATLQTLAESTDGYTSSRARRLLAALSCD